MAKSNNNHTTSNNNKKKSPHISVSTRRGREARRITAGFKESTFEILKAIRNGIYA